MQRLFVFLLFLPSFVVVVAQPSKDSLVSHLDDFVCTAQPCPTPVRNAIHPVRVIDNKTIQNRAVNNLEELLAGETNFRFKTDLVIGSGIQIGGVGGENVKILIDGVPVIGRMGGNVDLSQIPLYNVQKIEIIQGSLSTMYGSNASGGVINIITKKNQLNAIEVKANSQIESINISNHNANIGFQHKKYLIQLGGGIYQFTGLPSDSLRSVLWNPKKQYSTTSTIKYYLTDNQQISVTYNFFKEKVDNLGDIKLPNTKYSYAFDDFYHTKRNDFNVSYQGTWNKFTIQSTVAYNSFYRLKEAIKHIFTSDKDEYLPSEQQDTSSFNSFLTRTVGVYKFSSRMNLQAGIETYYESATGVRIKDTTNTNINHSDIGDYAIFAALKIQPFKTVPGFTIQPAVRTSYNTKYNAPVSPSINLMYRHDDAWTIRGSYARGFRAPSIKELYFDFIDINHYIVGNTNLKAEYSNNFVINPSLIINGETAQICIDAQGFYNYITNRIALAQYDAINLRYNYINVGYFKSKGVNFSASYQYKNCLKVKGSFAYTGFFNDLKTEYQDAPTYIYSPEAALEVNYTIPHTSGLNLNILHRYTGELPNFSIDRINNTINRGTIGDYSMLNATLSKGFWKNHLNVAMGAKNILNVTNIGQTGGPTTGHGALGNAVPINFGRSYFVRLGVNFGAKA